MPRDPDHERHLATRQSLLQRLTNLEDQKSWVDFHDTYWRLIFGMGIKAGLTRTEAEDALQETVITVARTIDGYRYKPEVTFKGWLGFIAKRRIADQFRKRSREIIVVDRAGEGSANGVAIEKMADPAGSVFDAIWDEEWQQHRIEAALEKLKPQVSVMQYQVFYLYIIKKQPARKVAKAIGVNVGQVYLVKHRLTGLFKQALEKVERNEP